MYISHKLLLLFACFVLSQAAIPDPCYDSFNNGDLTTGFYVTDNPPFPSPYACNPASTNVAAGATAGYVLSVAATSAADATCAQLISRPEVSFGYYECEVQVSGIAGTITTCQVASSTKSNYESVYFKFIGNETERVFTGYYANGRSYPTGPVQLQFDATDKKHKYGFEWTSGYIKWYVDGHQVSSADGGKALPTTPNHFYVSLFTENPKIPTDDSLLPTDPSVDRTFTGLAPTPIATFTNISYTPVIFVSCTNDGILPGSNGYAAFDPANCDTRDRFIIYDDKFAKGWSTEGSTNLKANSLDPVRTGTSAILWDALPTPSFGRLYITSATTFDAADYYSFIFWINGGYEKSGQQITVKMLLGETATPSTVEVKLNTVLDEGVQQQTWSRVVLPFSLFGINPNTSQAVKGFLIASPSSEYGGQIAIDEISLGYELPMCANKTKVIYDDKMAKGVTDASWGIYKLQSNLVPHAGSNSIQWGMYSSSGIHLKTFQVSSSEYQGISFWLNTKEATGSKWTIAVTSPNGDPANNNRIGLPLELTKYYGGPIPQQQDQWSYVVLPFYEFGITAATKIDGFVLQLSTNQFQGNLYIDDVNYIRQEKGKSSAAVSLGAGLTGIFVMLAVLLL